MSVTPKLYFLFAVFVFANGMIDGPCEIKVVVVVPGESSSSGKNSGPTHIITSGSGKLTSGVDTGKQELTIDKKSADVLAAVQTMVAATPPVSRASKLLRQFSLSQPSDQTEYTILVRGRVELQISAPMDQAKPPALASSNPTNDAAETNNASAPSGSTKFTPIVRNYESLSDIFGGVDGVKPKIIKDSDANLWLSSISVTSKETKSGNQKSGDSVFILRFPESLGIRHFIVGYFPSTAGKGTRDVRSLQILRRGVGELFQLSPTMFKFKFKKFESFDEVNMKDLVTQHSYPMFISTEPVVHTSFPVPEFFYPHTVQELSMMTTAEFDEVKSRKLEENWGLLKTVIKANDSKVKFEKLMCYSQIYSEMSSK